MNNYILGRIGNLNREEFDLRKAAAIELEQQGHTPVNFSNEEFVSFDDKSLQIVKEVSYLIQADAVTLLADFNECNTARLLLLLAVEMQLPIQPVRGCEIPPRIVHFTSF